MARQRSMLEQEIYEALIEIGFDEETADLSAHEQAEGADEEWF